MKKYVVKTSDGYLCPRDGDVGWTPDLAAAGRFDSQDEAEDTATVIGYHLGEFEVTPVAA